MAPPEHWSKKYRNRPKDEPEDALGQSMIKIGWGMIGWVLMFLYFLALVFV
jgi:hypothetical protein